MIKAESIDALKGIIDIVDVVSNYIELKKTGANYKACCPFHAEKTASFVVSPNKQIYHCFGCHASGDAIKFVEEYEKIGYQEALEKLASMYNISLDYTTTQKKTSDILERFNEFFKKNLKNMPHIRQYLSERGVFESSIEKFELGYAPGANEQMHFLRQTFLSGEDAVEYGIFGQDNERMFPRLIERVTFPIKNQHGKIIGFGGRTLTNHPAKYLNSPQTKFFNKSKVFYGLFGARDAIVRQKNLIVCEGYFDVIMLHQAGFTNAVAVLGTALTKEHLPFIKKADARVILAFDSDDAGLNAAYKSAQLLAQHGIGGGVAVFDKGLDPADMVKNQKDKELAHIFRKTMPFIEFLLGRIVAQYTLSDAVQKEKAVMSAKEIIAIQGDIFLEENKRLAAALLNVPLTVFKNTKDSQPTLERLEKYDLAEASAIKTILQNHTLIDTVLNRAGTEIFESHERLFSYLVHGDFEAPELIRLDGDSGIALMSEDELVSFVITKSTRHCDKELLKIKRDGSLSEEQKSFYLRKIMDIKTRLRRGEIVSFSMDTSH